MEIYNTKDWYLNEYKSLNVKVKINPYLNQCRLELQKNLSIQGHRLKNLKIFR